MGNRIIEMIAAHFDLDTTLLGVKSARSTVSGGTNRTEISGRSVNKIETMLPNKTPSAIARNEIANCNFNGMYSLNVKGII